jgi:hypothetical protein
MTNHGLGSAANGIAKRTAGRLLRPNTGWVPVSSPALVTVAS